MNDLVQGLHTGSSISKPMMPTPAPTIEIIPGIHAQLLWDADRFSNGSIVLETHSCGVFVGHDRVGGLVTDHRGQWFVEVGKALYAVPMKEIFNLFRSAHDAATAAPTAVQG